MPFAEDLSPFFNPAEFASSATLGAVAVVGVLLKTPADAFGVLGGTGIEFQLPTASVPADPRALALVVGVEAFTVRDFTADGTGVSTLQLEAA